MIFLCLGIGQREQGSGDTALGFPYAFHGGHLCRLMLQRVQAVQVAKHDLQGHEQGEKQQRHAHHDAALGARRPPQQIIGTDGEDHERRGDQECRDGVREPVWKGGREDHGGQAEREKTPVDDLVAGRRLHPAVYGENPER